MTSEERKLYYENNKAQEKERVANWRKVNRKKIKKSNKKWREANPNYNKKYRKINPEKIKKHGKKYYKTNSNEVKERQKVYREKPKSKLKRNKRLVKYIITNPLYKISHNLRNKIRLALKNGGYSKNGKHTEEILGYSFKFLKIYLEVRFKPWMNWENHGKYKKDVFNYGWDIDHIIPLSTAITKEDIIRLNHYSNLQPLCSKINRDIKKNSLNY